MKFETQVFFEKALKSATDLCLLWPYAKNELGYPRVMRGGKRGYAHRYMCAEAHGEPPSKSHVAEHICGSNDCVNPRHLKWSTQKENISRKKDHGTLVYGSSHYRATIDEDKAREIKFLIKEKMYTRKEIADISGVSPHVVADIKRGKTWRAA